MQISQRPGGRLEQEVRPDASRHPAIPAGGFHFGRDRAVQMQLGDNNSGDFNGLSLAIQTLKNETNHFCIYVYIFWVAVSDALRDSPTPHTETPVSCKSAPILQSSPSTMPRNPRTPAASQLLKSFSRRAGPKNVRLRGLWRRLLQRCPVCFRARPEMPRELFRWHPGTLSQSSDPWEW